MNSVNKESEKESCIGDDILGLCLRQLPCPTPDTVAYDNELKLALSTSERRRENYEKFKASSRLANLTYLPVKMDIENVSRCNFRCPKCQVSNWEGGRRSHDMTLESFSRILDILYGVVEIKLQGMGEPLLQGTPFFEMIKYARARHIWVRTTTNASLLHVMDNYRKLIEADPNEVQISVDGSCRTTFERIRHGSKFETVVNNCKLINKYCESRGLLKTRMWTCLQDQNVSEFLDFVTLAAELGFRRLSFAVNLHGWGQHDHFTINRKSAIELDGFVERALESVELGSRLGVSVSFWNNISKYEQSDISKLCPWPFERAFISSDMRIVPCCMIGNPDTADFGIAEDFEKNWFGSNYQEFRSKHIDGNVPDYCKACYLS